jgi:hypothetical protein
MVAMARTWGEYVEELSRGEIGMGGGSNARYAITQPRAQIRW